MEDTAGYSLAELLEAGEQLTARTQGIIDQLLAQRAEIDADIKRLRAFSRGLRPLTSPTSTPGPRKQGKPASARSLVRFAEAILTLNERQETFSVHDVMDLTGHRSSDTPRRAMEQLRDMQFLAAAGSAYPQGQTMGHKRKVFRVMDAHVIDQLRAVNAS